MTVSVRGPVPTRWSPHTAQHITERFKALEKAVGDGSAAFLSPATPTFGAGTITGGGGSTGGGGGGGGAAAGVTDHGALTGLADDDHPQYIAHGESAPAFPHTHLETDVVGVEERFVERGESVSPAQHQHLLTDVSDFNRWEMMLWRRVYGG